MRLPVSPSPWNRSPSPRLNTQWRCGKQRDGRVQFEAFSWRRLWRVYVECVLLMDGLQPHLAWVRLIGLWLGGAAHLWCMRVIMAPRINQPSTHTLEEEPQPWQLYHQLGEYHQPVKLQINILYYIYPCPVSEGPKRSHLGGVWRTNPATATILNVLWPADFFGLLYLHLTLFTKVTLCCWVFTRSSVIHNDLQTTRREGGGTPG